MFEVEAGADEKQQIKFVWPNSKYMTTSEVIRVLDEVSIASSGPNQSPDSAAAVLTAAALLSAAVSFLSSRRNLVRDRSMNY